MINRKCQALHSPHEPNSYGHDEIGNYNGTDLKGTHELGNQSIKPHLHQYG